MSKVFVTHPIPELGLKMLRDKGYEVEVHKGDRALLKDELVSKLKEADAVLSLLVDRFDEGVIAEAGKQLKIIANYAVGYDNIDVAFAQKNNIIVTNTPDVPTGTVAEHTFALILSIAHRVAEGDRFTRAGKYHGWEPMLLLGDDVSKKTLGVVGLGRIGSRVAYHALHGFEMNVIYTDIKRNEQFEKEFNAVYKTLDELLAEADFVSLHVPLLPQTKHLMNKERLGKMKKTAYLVNTSRGPVIDEKALAEALSSGVIAGAALDVFEFEPSVVPELLALENVIVTPHIASATHATRSKMSEIAAQNIIAVLEGGQPITPVKL